MVPEAEAEGNKALNVGLGEVTATAGWVRHVAILKQAGLK